MRVEPTEEQLALPVDQYQRHFLTSAIVQGLVAGNPSPRVLDVGGAPGPVEIFLPGMDVAVVDMQGSHSGGRFVLASGAALPFPDASFDVVISLDTLEHVPGPIRDAFLRELVRVSRGPVVLSAPFDEPGVADAEAALLQFICERLAPTFPTGVWLTEHRDLGLPTLAASKDSLGGPGRTVLDLPSGYLPRWLGSMIVDHELLATGLPAMDQLHGFYNRHVSPHDVRQPAYRHIIVAVGDEQAALAAELLDLYRSAEQDSARADTWVMALSSAVLQRRLGPALSSGDLAAAQGRIAELEGTVRALERTVADRDAHLIQLRERVEDGQAALAAAMAEGPMTRTVRDAAGRVGRTIRGRRA